MMIQLMIILLLLLIRFKSSFNVLKPPSPSKVQSLLRSPDAKTNSKIVIIVGFEAFNFELYKKTVSIVRGKVPSVDIEIFTDMDITESPERVEKALDGADVLFASLLFDYAQVNWILPKIENIPVRFVFESAQELMSETSVGEFKMRPSETGQMAGPPPFVKSLLKQFGSAKEEDKMAGYLKLLKIGPKVLNLVPRRGSLGEKLKDVRAWLTVYSYWNQGSVPNVVSMLYYIIDTFGLAASTAEIPVAQSLIEAPDSAFYHPKLFETDGYVESARQYVLWYERNHAWVTADTPRVGLLLYRKHVLSDQSYICNLITLMETEGIMPIPIFITGVEAHVIVRDIFVTKNEVPNPRQLTGDRVFVDAIVNTIGFPLVGGPAGSMEGGRQIEVSKAILSSKNVPYIVAAPLLIQDMGSWQQTGVQGLQTVILYSLPELDAAIDTIVLGGLVNKENIIVLPERVRKLTQRLKAWVRLAKLPNKDKKISMLLYGFPPNVGAVGTAALLNVARSLRNVLLRLHSEGYNIGSRELVTLLQNDEESGELLIKALTSIAKNARSKQTILADLLALGLKDITLVHREVSWRELQGWIGKQMTQKIASNWGELEVYTDVGSAGSGILLVQGLQVGNIFLGLQPLLGVEGDPMRMLFERDLTPHPQYATYYAWLQKELRTDALVHFGMHGTVEWLPGTPLGNTPESWPDLLLGDLPNLYIYACNNPSESILAKRRGYGKLSIFVFLFTFFIY